MRHRTSKQMYWLAGTVVLVAVCAVVIWKLNTTRPSPLMDRTASAEIVTDFFKSLAALDVQESELAASVLGEAVQTEPREPALWVNLAVARLRLRDMAGARDALRHATSLADQSRELAVLRAELLEHSGETEAAIEQLRHIREEWPEDIAATYSLASLLGQLRSKDADAERLSLLSSILELAPDNLRARCEQSRLAASLEQGDALGQALAALADDSSSWSDVAKEQLDQANRAARADDLQNAARSLTFLENVLKSRADYQQSLTQLGVTSDASIGSPLRTFLRLELPKAEAAEADTALAFELQETPNTAARPDLVLALEQAGERRSTLMSFFNDTLQVGESAALPFPGSSIEATPSSIAAADLNFDFVQDLVLAGTEGCRIVLGREDGSFVVAEVSLDEFARPWRSVWTVDVDADGDLDILLSDDESNLLWVRNNGDMTFTAMQDLLPAAASVRELAYGDLDGDGDLDLAVLDTAGTITVWRNDRGGRYSWAMPPVTNRVALTVGDIDRDGSFDLVSLTESGEVHAATLRIGGSTWFRSLLERGQATLPPSNLKPGDTFLAVVDIDNNGAVDVIVSRRFETLIWLRTAADTWEELDNPAPLYVTSLADVNDDGLLDLVGMSEDGARVALNRSQAGYGWQVIETMANTAEGDKRINSFGVGGKIEVRAGNLVQASVIRAPRTHFGLGEHKLADVARIVWPNGTVQAEFDLQANSSVVAKQRLKGSCPWVFAFDGTEFRFVKDFIWRSPLGLRINAQDTAGVAQTEDWITIPGEQLARVNGQYLLRITAELWETHFFDHVSLLAVDHPGEVEILVDERFVPTAPPVQRVLTVTPLQPVINVIDHRGNSLDETLREADGVYADGFSLGEYQGVAEEHWVEFDLPGNVDTNRDVLLVANGWVYPTDSSLNVALSQGTGSRPFGLILEQRDSSGVWHALSENLGFPAGKNKDVVIALPRDLPFARHFRLRTNMEVYWDSMGWSYEVADGEPRLTSLAARVARLHYRGYSRMLPIDRRRPDTPLYDVEATEPRWLDLEGYYTRFGDVRELLATIDDRYVIMNAGDELVFEFEGGKDVPSGWRRDFILVGDGWVKDGDFNTAFSQWVRPLPTHEDGAYDGPLNALERDAVYLQHPEDWRVFHTRYVAPRRFQRGLWPSARRQVERE